MNPDRIDTLAAWHATLRQPTPQGLRDLLAEDAVFHSPVVHTPQAGRDKVIWYLGAAFQVLNNETFRYVREVVGERDAVLEFECEIDGIRIDGVDMIRWRDDGRIVDFKVMVRPLKAINLLHAKMREMLERMAPGAAA
jgi:hypothetical protein